MESNAGGVPVRYPYGAGLFSELTQLLTSIPDREKERRGESYGEEHPTKKISNPQKCVITPFSLSPQPLRGYSATFFSPQKRVLDSSFLNCRHLAPVFAFPAHLSQTALQIQSAAVLTGTTPPGQQFVFKSQG